MSTVDSYMQLDKSKNKETDSDPPTPTKVLCLFCFYIRAHLVFYRLEYQILK